MNYSNTANNNNGSHAATLSAVIMCLLGAAYLVVCRGLQRMLEAMPEVEVFSWVWPTFYAGGAAAIAIFAVSAVGVHKRSRCCAGFLTFLYGATMIAIIVGLYVSYHPIDRRQYYEWCEYTMCPQSAYQPCDMRGCAEAYKFGLIGLLYVALAVIGVFGWVAMKFTQSLSGPSADGLDGNAYLLHEPHQSL